MSAFRKLEQHFQSTERLAPPPPEILLHRGLNETWFSDTLAWLLDPMGEHGLGVSFLERFVELVGFRRSDPAALCHHGQTYERADHRLKFDDEGIGTRFSTLHLANGTPLREFLLSPKIGARGAQYCDLILVNLDAHPSFVLAIENKLFAKDHPGQLSGYFETIEEKFSGASVREFVYLTLREECPEDDEEACRAWARLSWLWDVLWMLEHVVGEAENPAAHVRELVLLLKWLGAVLEHEDEGNPVDRASLYTCLGAFSTEYVQAATEHIVQELNRTSASKRGTWSIAKRGKKSCRIEHSAARTRRIDVGLHSNHALTIRGRSRDRDPFAKVVVPFGAHPDQAFHLLELAAQEVQRGFGSKSAADAGTNGPQSPMRPAASEEQTALFRFAHERRHALRVVFGLVRLSW